MIYLSREDSHFCKVSNNKSFSVGVQSPTKINAPRGCAVILRRICQLSLTRITHQVSRAFDLNERQRPLFLFHNLRYYNIFRIGGIFRSAKIARKYSSNCSTMDNRLHR